MALRIDVAVVGGGAAGLMCAITAAQRGRSVLVIEGSNKVGKKILMSGGGRCNFTNLHCTPANFLSRNPHFCKSALARYRPADFIALVERHGIAYHEKELGQLFCDDTSRQIVQLLRDECATAGVRIELDCTVTAVRATGPGFHLDTTGGEIECAALVVATGGLSIPKMGATGWGYDLARQFDHRVLPTRAGLVPLTFAGEEAGHWADLAGVSITAATRGGPHRWVNGLLFTHHGISGPTVLQASSYWQPGTPLIVDLAPDLDVVAWLREQRTARPDAALHTVLGELWTKRFATRWCEVVFPSRPLRQLQPPDLETLALRLHEHAFQPAGTEGYRTAEVTLGGVDTDGLSSSTLESKSVPGLYFIGEVVDVTGHLGGHNFQWAWASGHAAGEVA